MVFEIFHKYHIRICAIVFLDIFGTSHSNFLFFLRTQTSTSFTFYVLFSTISRAFFLFDISNLTLNEIYRHTHTHTKLSRGTRGPVDTDCIQKFRRKSRAMGISVRGVQCDSNRGRRDDGIPQ